MTDTNTSCLTSTTTQTWIQCTWHLLRWAWLSSIQFSNLLPLSVKEPALLLKLIQLATTITTTTISRLSLCQIHFLNNSSNSITIFPSLPHTTCSTCLSLQQDNNNNLARLDSLFICSSNRGLGTHKSHSIRLLLWAIMAPLHLGVLSFIGAFKLVTWLMSR